ncbi:enoyl-CoA hydratase 2, peroxisomal-like [Hordeum vulgare subsp. vulgare]|uniref:enoyl-CoA hydratase 2, peroxisomal-like n=1 Tax=Hordeum vulgare subsp. vulgare TaxID=112509 RepID=UPI001D1A56B6|nr:enoyl-CoA hydratase 2, peroxisomal-like [Hordeum vulgare subsp. vulgare]
MEIKTSAHSHLSSLGRTVIPHEHMFTRPILHDLYTLGFAARAVIKSFCNGDPAAMQNIFGRFLLHVYPGEMLVTEMWVNGQRVQYQTKVKERDRAVLSGYVLLKQHIPSSL